MSSEDRDRDAANPLGAVLRGVRVVSIALNVPGPVAVGRLTTMGGEVTTVLPPAGDPTQQLPALFEELHEGQRVVTLDLKDAGDRECMDGLLREADLFITAHRPSALARLGLDEAATRERFPRLCRVDVVGYPGADAEVPGHDLMFQAGHGLVRPGHLPVTLGADLMAAERVVTAALAVLRARDGSGAGVRTEVAISEAARALALPLRHGLTAPGGILRGGDVFYGIYPAAEGSVALAALEPQFRERLVRLLGISADPAVPSEFGPELMARLRERTAAEWEAWGREHDVPVAAMREATGPAS